MYVKKIYVNTYVHLDSQGFEQQQQLKMQWTILATIAFTDQVDKIRN